MDLPGRSCLQGCNTHRFSERPRGRTAVISPASRWPRCAADRSSSGLGTSAPVRLPMAVTVRSTPSTATAFAPHREISLSQARKHGVARLSSETNHVFISAQRSDHGLFKYAGWSGLQALCRRTRIDGSQAPRWRGEVQGKDCCRRRAGAGRGGGVSRDRWAPHIERRVCN